MALSRIAGRCEAGLGLRTVPSSVVGGVTVGVAIEDGLEVDGVVADWLWKTMRDSGRGAALPAVTSTSSPATAVSTLRSISETVGSDQEVVDGPPADEEEPGVEAEGNDPIGGKVKDDGAGGGARERSDGGGGGGRHWARCEWKAALSSWTSARRAASSAALLDELPRAVAIGQQHTRRAVRGARAHLEAAGVAGTTVGVRSFSAMPSQTQSPGRPRLTQASQGTVPSAEHYGEQAASVGRVRSVEDRDPRLRQRTQGRHETHPCLAPDALVARERSPLTLGRPDIGSRRR